MSVSYCLWSLLFLQSRTWSLHTLPTIPYTVAEENHDICLKAHPTLPDTGGVASTSRTICLRTYFHLKIHLQGLRPREEIIIACLPWRFLEWGESPRGDEVRPLRPKMWNGNNNNILSVAKSLKKLVCIPRQKEFSTTDTQLAQRFTWSIDVKSSGFLLSLANALFHY